MGLSKTRPVCGCRGGVLEAAGTVTSPENVFKSGLLMKMKTSSSRAIFWTGATKKSEIVGLHPIAGFAVR